MSLFDAFFGKCKECGDGRAYNVIHGSCQSCSWGYITGTLPPPMPFAVADKVEAFGNEGFVKSISKNGMFIEVSFAEAPTTVVFTNCGRVHNWNKRPSLRKL